MPRLLFLLLAFCTSIPTVLAADISGQDFLLQSTGATRFQLAGSQLAQRKTKADAVQAFAQQMVADYTVAGMKLRQAIAEAKLPAPRDALDTTHKALFDTLSHTAPGKAFAKAYLDLQDEALRGDLALYEAYAQRGDTERLKYFAGEMVPIVRAHLEQLGKIRK